MLKATTGVVAFLLVKHESKILVNVMHERPGRSRRQIYIMRQQLQVYRVSAPGVVVSKASVQVNLIIRAESREFLAWYDLHGQKETLDLLGNYSRKPFQQRLAKCIIENERQRLIACFRPAAWIGRRLFENQSDLRTLFTFNELDPKIDVGPRKNLLVVGADEHHFLGQRQTKCFLSN